jgi:hypothetical protein
VSSKEGTLFKESGHDSQEKNSVNFWPKYFSVVGGRTVRIHIVCMILYSPYSRMDLTWKSRNFGHEFRGRFLFSVHYFWAIRNNPYNGLWARKMRYKRGWTVVQFWHRK